MKTCPTCNAIAFDDAKVCYGCLHRYDEEPYDPGIPLLENSSEQTTSPDVSLEEQPQQSSYSICAIPGFTIKIVPIVEATGTIRLDCSVELLSSSQPT